jgi:hypothetical protein
MSYDNPPPPPTGGDYPPPPPPPPTDEPPKRKRQLWPLLVGGLLLAVVIGVVAAVAGDDDEPTRRTSTDDEESADTTDAPSTTRGTTPPAQPEPSPPTTTSSDVAKVGPNEWFTWTEGVEAQVTSLRVGNVEYTSLPGPHMIATVTVKNGSGGTMDLAMATANAYGGPNGVQAESDGLYGFEGSVPPGGNATAEYAWAMPAEHHGQIRIEFAPSFEHDPAFFEGAAA